jgi:hypothetical protein
MSEPRDLRRPPLPPEEFPEEKPTGILCEACGGEYRILSETETGHRMSICRHCHEGVMTPSQLRDWRAKKGR